MSYGKKGTKGVNFNMTLPPEVVDIIDARADALYSTRNELLRRWICEHVRDIAPEAA